MPREVEIKSVLNKKKYRDKWFLDDYTFNPYSACGFNCLYCYIRGSKYGSNLETAQSVKVNAIEVLDRQLYTRAKKGQQGVVVISSATDPYLRLEEKYQLTRQALELLLKYRFPVHMVTKSSLVERDFDLLEKIDKNAILPKDLPQLRRGVILTFSFSTLEDSVGAIFEPGATPPSERLLTMQRALKTKFKAGVSLMPLIPYISDTTEQLDLAFSTFASMGSHYVMPATITLFGNGKADSKTLMLGAIRKHYPHLLSKYQKFFAASNEMPRYYQKAFYHKMKELGAQYGLPHRIVYFGQVHRK